MLKKIFSAKGWLIGAGVIHGIMGVIVQLVMSADVAEMAWGKGNVLAHDATYEAIMGFALLPHVAAIFGAAFLLSGVTQAKMAALLGGTTMVAFLAMVAVGSNSGYMADMGPMAAYAPPIILFGGLTLSGVLHMKEG